jgi:tRNA(His) guanylyltransferase
MNFDVLDAKMRVFEESHDQSVLPGIFMVARLDGRGFTGLTKERHSFQAPFDERFRDMMAAATEHVMTCGVRAVFGYTQSDEISVLLHRDCDSFSRKLRKLTSILAGEASAKFSLLLSDIGAFDCRISQLPSAQEEGQSVSIATGTIKGLSVSAKNELLFKRGINFNDLPAWQKRGIGMKWEEFDKEGVNPKTGQVAIARRRRLHRIMDLPRGDEYTAMLRDIAAAAVAE